jgi:hypothetical protein
MKHIATYMLLVFGLMLGDSICFAQDVAADSFLEHVSAHPVGDQAERDQSSLAYSALNVAQPAEVTRVLPSVLQHMRSGNDARVRQYAIMFLLAIALRPDGAHLLASSAKEVSGLLVDAEPEIQREAAYITYWVIAGQETDKQPYLSALLAAIQKPQTPQEAAVDMAAPLLRYGSSDPNSKKAVIAFLHRSDLTESTRIYIVHGLAGFRDLPTEVSQCLVNELDDPSLRVRAAAVIAFSNSYYGYNLLAKDRVEKIAKDPSEDARLRALAKEALAGHSPLNPNIDITPYDPSGTSH